MKRTALAVALLVATAYPLVTGCNIDPVKAIWSGRVRPDSGIAQGLGIKRDTLLFG